MFTAAGQWKGRLHRKVHKPTRGCLALPSLFQAWHTAPAGVWAWAQAPWHLDFSWCPGVSVCIGTRLLPQINSLQAHALPGPTQGHQADLRRSLFLSTLQDMSQTSQGTTQRGVGTPDHSHLPWAFFSMPGVHSQSHLILAVPNVFTEVVPQRSPCSSHLHLKAVVSSNHSKRVEGR